METLRNIHAIRVEIEEVRRRNAHLLLQLEPFETWLSETRCAIEQFSLDHDVDLSDSDDEGDKAKYMQLLSDTPVPSDSSEEQLDSDEAREFSRGRSTRGKRGRRGGRRTRQQEVTIDFEEPTREIAKKPEKLIEPQAKPSEQCTTIPVRLMELPKFPYRYYTIPDGITVNQVLVPGTNITLRSPVYELLNARPDLARIVFRSARQ